jgi:hypothetical protein
MLVEIDWKQTLIQDYVFQTYSDIDAVDISIPKEDNWNFLEEVLKSCARQFTKR